MDGILFSAKSKKDGGKKLDTKKANKVKKPKVHDFTDRATTLQERILAVLKSDPQQWLSAQSIVEALDPIDKQAVMNTLTKMVSKTKTIKRKKSAAQFDSKFWHYSAK